MPPAFVRRQKNPALKSSPYVAISNETNKPAAPNIPMVLNTPITVPVTGKLCPRTLAMAAI